MLLKNCNFGFVHQILTFTRGRKEALGMTSVDMRMDLPCRLYTLKTYGADYLNAEDFEMCQERLLSTYYNFLAVSVMRGRRDKKFWDLHKRKLNETVGFSRTRLVKAVLSRMCRAVLNPYETFGKLVEKTKRAPGIESRETSNGIPLSIKSSQ